MKLHGTYKIRYQGARGAARGALGGARGPSVLDGGSDDPIEELLARVATAERRTQRLVESLCEEIRLGGESVSLSIRRIFSQPREVFRIELQRPEFGYQRTTLLGREALEALLETEDVRHAVERLARSA